MIFIDHKINTYQIITIPFELDDNHIKKVFDELPEPDTTKWRLLRHVNDGETLIEYTGTSSSLTNLEVGKGYWFNAIEDAMIFIGAGKSPLVTRENPYVITLENGWNQIGNQYNFEIKWSDVIAANDSIDEDLGPLRLFKNGTFVDGQLLEPFRGGFVRWNGGDTPVLIIPLVSNETAGGRTSEINTNNYPISDESWEVQLSLETAQMTNNLSGFGMHPLANLSKDRFDEITVPRFFNYLEVNFYHLEFDAPKFSKDIVPTQENHIWEFNVETNVGNGGTSMSWENNYFGNNLQNLILYDLTNQKVTDMKGQNHYTFPKAIDTKFKIIFGSTSFIANNLKPTQITLGPNHPNPFQNSTQIPFSLSKSDEVFQVSLEIYDLTGKKIRELINDIFKPGFYSINWDGTNQMGQKLPAGIYIYSLSINNGYQSKVISKKLIVK